MDNNAPQFIEILGLLASYSTRIQTTSAILHKSVEVSDEGIETMAQALELVRKVYDSLK